MPKFLEYERWSKAKTVAVKCHALAVSLKQAGETEIAAAILKEALQFAGCATSKAEGGGVRPPIQLSTMLSESRRLQSDLLIAAELGLVEQAEITPIIEQIDEIAEQVRAAGKEAADTYKEKMAERLKMPEIFDTRFED